MKFYIKQKVFTLKDQFSIMDEQQNPVFQVRGKMFSISNKLQLQLPDGSLVLHAKRKVLSFMPTYFLYSPQDEEIAVVKRRFGLRPKFDVQVFNRNLEVDGSFWGHNFTVSDGSQMLASIEKKLISWGDTYQIDVLDESNVEILLFLVIIIDQIVHEAKQRNRVNFS